MDYQLTRFFFACNISTNVANHPEWKKLVTRLRTAPVDYKPPDRRKLYGPLLETTVLNLQAETQHLRDAVLRDCGTFMSDGWDTADHDHLINFLFGTPACMFFEGTVELKSSDHEDANYVYLLMAEAIVRIGALAIVQIVTDTCAVMQARTFVRCATLLPSAPHPFRHSPSPARWLRPRGSCSPSASAGSRRPAAGRTCSRWS